MGESDHLWMMLRLPNLGVICQQAAAALSQEAPVAVTEGAAATLPVETAPPMQEPALAVTAKQSAERASHALVTQVIPKIGSNKCLCVADC